MRPVFTLQLRLVDYTGKHLVAQGIELDTFDFNLNIPKPFLGGLEDMAQAMKARQRRRDLLVRQALQMGEGFADFLDDADGWHGEERQDKTRANWRRT